MLIIDISTSCKLHIYLSSFHHKRGGGGRCSQSRFTSFCYDESHRKEYCGTLKKWQRNHRYWHISPIFFYHFLGILWSFSLFWILCGIAIRLWKALEPKEKEEGGWNLISFYICCERQIIWRYPNIEYLIYHHRPTSNQ